MLNNLRKKRIQKLDDFVFFDQADIGFQWVGESVSYQDDVATLGKQRYGQKERYRTLSRTKNPKAKSSYVNGVWFDMLYCPKGSFSRRSTFYVDDPRLNRYEIKQIWRPFLLGETEVTQELYHAVMGKNPSYWQTPTDLQRPVENVSWNDAIRFCNKLSKLQGLEEYYKDGNYESGYRLAKRDEWEYAAKAGTDNLWAGTSDSSKLGEYAWNVRNTDDKNRVQPVARLKPNEWGFYDMTGNVHEWCDEFSVDFWGKSPYVGGCANDIPIQKYMKRIGEIVWVKPTDKSMYKGFRIARSFIE